MNLAVQPTPEEIERGVADVLAAIGRETGELHLAAVRLQAMAGELIERARLPAHHPLIEEAQELDAVAQKLDALTGFIARLAAAAPQGWRLDIAEAVEPVFLADLAKRLCREHAPEDDSGAVSGDFELF
jgi:hypothetical protein